MRNFRNLEIWQKSISLAKNIYALTSSFPEQEKFGLISQLQRASVSIASNIAEGSSRKSNQDFARFLEMAIGSAFEIETQLTIAKELGYLDQKLYAEVISEINIIQKQINTLITKIRS
jgi:four helix bundle protein